MFQILEGILHHYRRSIVSRNCFIMLDNTSPTDVTYMYYVTLHNRTVILAKAPTESECYREAIYYLLENAL